MGESNSKRRIGTLEAAEGLAGAAVGTTSGARPLATTAVGRRDVAAGGRVLPISFWRRFLEIDNVVAIKMAPFNRYRTLDVEQLTLVNLRLLDDEPGTGLAELLATTIERALATGKIAGLASRLTRARSFDGLVDDLASDGWVLLEVRAQTFVQEGSDNTCDIGIQFAFGLTFELRLRQLHADHRD